MVKISNIEKLERRSQRELLHRLYILEKEIRSINHLDSNKKYVVTNEIQKTRYALSCKRGRL